MCFKLNSMKISVNVYPTVFLFSFPTNSLKVAENDLQDLKITNNVTCNFYFGQISRETLVIYLI